MISATQAEVDAAVDAVAAALQHPLMRAARAAGTACRREAPVVLREADGSLIEGVLDLAFRVTEGSRTTWIVVDYKTDAELATQREEYETQIRLYARAVAVSTGEPARGVLLRV
jgi:ATP-dependent exoDNAse (exonuclease V) beta subunit